MLRHSGAGHFLPGSGAAPRPFEEAVLSTAHDETELPATDAADYGRIQREEHFQQLKRSFRRFAFPVTVGFLAWYLLYVILSGWARGFMGQKLIGNINVAFVLGVLQFVSTFLITWLYERHMNRHVDPLAERIVRDHEELGR